MWLISGRHKKVKSIPKARSNIFLISHLKIRKADCALDLIWWYEMCSCRTLTYCIHILIQTPLLTYTHSPTPWMWPVPQSYQEARKQLRWKKWNMSSCMSPFKTYTFSESMQQLTHSACKLTLFEVMNACEFDMFFSLVSAHAAL